MQISAALFFGLRFFDWNAVCIRPCVLANPCDLPRHLQADSPPANLELIVSDLFGDIDWGESTDTG